jgi:hypothetical protein
MDLIIILVCVFVFVALLFYGAFKWFQVFNGPDGERYRRTRMQGPFVPLDKDES